MELKLRSNYNKHVGRESGNDFFVPQFSDGSVTFPGTRKRNKNFFFPTLHRKLVVFVYFC